MNNENLVRFMDKMVTQLDQALDELVELDSPESHKAESLILAVSLELTGLMDRIVDELEGEVAPELPTLSRGYNATGFGGEGYFTP